MIPKKTTKISACYLLYETHDIEDINLEEVEDHWVKYGTLMLQMKDGELKEIEGEGGIDSVDWKNPQHELTYYDDDWNEL